MKDNIKMDSLRDMEENFMMMVHFMLDFSPMISRKGRELFMILMVRKSLIKILLKLFEQI
jgi:hypothetical protein